MSIQTHITMILPAPAEWSVLYVPALLHGCIMHQLWSMLYAVSMKHPLFHVCCMYEVATHDLW